MKISKIDFAVIFLGFVSLFIALLVDSLLPPEVIVTPLYAVPIVVVAFRYNWKVVLFFTALSLGFFTIRAGVEHLSLINYLFKEVLFFMVCVLSAQFSIHREKNTRLTQEAESARRRQQLLMDTISHDLIQPITAAKMYVEILTRMGGQKHKNITSKLTDAINHLLFLANDLKDAAGMERGVITLHKVKLDLIELISKTVEQQQQTLSIHTFKVVSEPSIIGVWDQDRLTQLFANLLSNAVKYSPKGGEIMVVANKVINSVFVSVTDHGVGISRDQYDKLFQPFVRLHTNLAVKGTGLGLYICKAITEAHGGRIWVISKKGKGSTFIVRLPLKMLNHNQ